MKPVMTMQAVKTVKPMVSVVKRGVHKMKGVTMVSMVTVVQSVMTVVSIPMMAVMPVVGIVRGMVAIVILIVFGISMMSMVAIVMAVVAMMAVMKGHNVMKWGMDIARVDGLDEKHGQNETTSKQLVHVSVFFVVLC